MQKSIFTLFLTIATIFSAYSQEMISANDDYADCAQNRSVDVHVTGNDFIPDTSFYSLSITTPPVNGYASVMSRDKIQYEPEFNYTGPDSLTYLICDSNSCNSATVFINVIPDSTQQECKADFEHHINGRIVNFFDKSFGGHGLTHDWFFGDGAGSTDPNPTYSYPNDGEYTVTLIIRDSTGCSDTANRVIFVRQDTTTNECSADFNFEQSGDGTAYFFANHSEDSTFYSWDFGDGNTGSGNSPEHTYGSSAAYNVCLIISSPGCVDTVCKEIFVEIDTSECKAAFQARVNGLTTEFLDKSNNASTWNWNFGDGNTSSTQNPVHTYSEPGEYMVTLTIFSDSMTCSDTAQQFIFVSNDTTGKECSADFGFQSGDPGNIFFFAFHQEDSTFYSWDFGDSNSGSGQSPNHQYANSGEYNVCLVVSTPECSDTVCKIVFVDIDTSACRAKFSRKTQGLSVEFFDHSLNASTWNWNFGDGNTSTIQNPNHTYGESGEYMVTLTIFDDSMQCSDTAQQFLFVSNDTTNNECMAHFSYEMMGDTIFFVDKSQNATSWFWDFNDGTTSTEQNPIKISDTSFFVCLTITGPDSCTSTSCAEVGPREKKESLFGIVYFDVNGNGKRDSMEAGLDEILVSLDPDNIHTNTKHEGSFFMEFNDSGNHNLKVNVPTNWTITEPATNNGSYDIQTDGSGKHYGPYLFGLTRPDNIKDLCVKVAGFGRTRPGFETYYGINVKNIGSEAMNGTVTFAYDDLVTVTSSTPTWASHDTSAKVITWSFIDLVPGNHLYFQVNGKVKLNATFQDSLVSLVEVTPITGDANPANNSHKLVQQVRASYDPNDKQVVPEGKGEQNYIGLDPEELLYTIRFQNTGNDTAIFINIEDEIDTDLDFSTLTIVGSSHEVEFSVIEGRLVNFGFEDILLPDSNVDEPGSHGFVQYTIKPNPSLPVETVIENTASIIFDFNEPVITNTTKSTIGEVKTNTSIQTLGFNNRLSLFPNPTNDVLNIKLDVMIEKGELILMDISGRILESRSLINETSLQLSMKDLENGIYLISVSDRNGNKLTQRIIKN